MQRRTVYRPDFSANLSFWMLAIFCVILWISGGASRADVVGQPFTRFFAWAFLVAYVIVTPRFDWRRIRPVAVLLAISVLLVGFQLVPLPPAAWTDLPGRSMFSQAAQVTDQLQPWRPISISPSATMNALGSLIVPTTVLVLAANLTRKQHWRIASLILALIFAGCLIGLLQFSGAHFDNPLINDVKGAVSGNFANPNHFALFISLGCVLAPVLGFGNELGNRWKALASVALLPFFLLMLLATGSRMGLLLGVVGVVFGAFIVRSHAMRKLAALSRRTAIALVVGTVTALVLVVALSVTLDRAVSIDRAIGIEIAGDLRSQARPFVMEAIARYFPIGSGFGAFDPVYRIFEPDSLLRIPYFNHAHNDWLEILLDGGLAAGALLAAAVLWWIGVGVRVVNNTSQNKTLLYGAWVILLLIFVASLTDYPARTPMIMALVVLAAVWLTEPVALPHKKRSG